MLLKHLPVAIVSLLLVGLAALAEDKGEEPGRWSGFLGPPAVGLRADDLPLVWSPEKNIAWKASIPGYGQSSPVVWRQRVFVSSISGAMKDTCHVCAFDLRTGAKLWRRDLPAASKAENTNYISKAAPTPAVDANGVAVLFEGGNLVAWTHDGEVRWSRNLAADYGPIDARHGLASSLEQDDEHLYVWMERQEAPYVLAVSKATGETIWKAPGLGVTTWSSPRLVQVGESRHLVLSGMGKLAGLEPRAGKRLWEFDDISGNSTPTPIPLRDGRFLIGATDGRGESGGAAAASNGVVRIKKLEDGGFKAEFVWRAKRATCSFGSPIAHQGRAYFVNRAGVVFCLDLESGAELYAERTAGSIWATPIAVGKRIYLFGRNGTTTVIRSGPKFERLAENSLWEDEQAANAADPGNFGSGVLYAAAAVDSQWILRRGDMLYSIGR